MERLGRSAVIVYGSTFKTLIPIFGARMSRHPLVAIFRPATLVLIMLLACAGSAFPADPIVTGTAFGTPANPGYEPAMAFDGDASTFYEAPTPDGNWVGIDFGIGVAKVITQITYGPRVDQWNAGAYRMVDGIFQGSDTPDFSDHVIELYRIQDQPNGLTTVTVSNANGFRYVRYMSPLGSYGDIGEAQFRGHDSAGGIVATPSLSPAGGSASGLQVITLACATPDAAIRYTLDGSVPTVASPLYALSIALRASATVSARAFVGGMAPSSIASATFTISSGSAGTVYLGTATRTGAYNSVKPIVVTRALLAGKGGGSQGAPVFLTTAAPSGFGLTLPALTSAASASLVNVDMSQVGIPQLYTTSETNAGGGDVTATVSVGFPAGQSGRVHLVWGSMTNNTPGGATLSVTDQTSGQVFDQTGISAFAFTIGYNAPSQHNESVFDVSGSRNLLVKVHDHNDWNVSGYAYLSAIWVEGDQQVAPPVLSPAPGTYRDQVAVQLSSPTVGAAIRYTLDGSVPTTTSALYTGPITIDVTVQLKARAFATGLSQSDETAGAYTITESPPGSGVTAYVGSTFSNGIPASPGPIVVTSAVIAGKWADVGGSPAWFATSGPAGFGITFPAVNGGPGYGPAAVDMTALGIANNAPSCQTNTSGGDIVATVVLAPAAGDTERVHVVWGSKTYNSLGGAALTVTDQTNGRTLDARNFPDLSFTLGYNAPAHHQHSVFELTTCQQFRIAVRDRNAWGDSGRAYLEAVWVERSGGTVATPGFSPAGGTYSSAQTVTLSSSTPGAAIHYTLDGSTPTSVSPLASGPVTIDHSATLRAQAFLAGWTASATSSAAYVISGVQPVAAAPSFTPAPGTYAIPQAIVITSITSGAIIRYTIDGSDPTSSPTAQTVSDVVPVAQPVTLRAVTMAAGFLSSPIVAAAYTIQPPPSVALPTFSPSAGTFTGSVAIQAACATAGAVIRYSSDGSAPTSTSPIFPTTLLLKSTTTLSARAFAGGLQASAVATATFTITPQTPTLVVTPGPAVVAIGGTQTFQVAASDGAALGAITWSAYGGGSISSAGVFTAGTSAGTTTITATSGARSGAALVTVAAGPHLGAIAASPNPVTGSSTGLTLTLTDDIDTSGIVCTWSVPANPASGVVFTANGSPAAQATTAIFAAAGTYQLQVVARDARGLSASGTVMVVVAQTPMQVSVQPSVTTVNPGLTQSFSAAVLDQFGSAIATPSVTWTATGGTISAAGVFTAGSTLGTFTVTAHSGGVSGAAGVAVTNAPVITAMTASPALVVGTTSSLHVQATDPLGAAALTYAWSAFSGPGSPSFSPNGSNAAATTTVTFNRAGSYLLQVVATDTGSRTGNGTVTVTVAQTPTSVSLNQGFTVFQGSTFQFTPTLLDQFGYAIPSPAATWTATGGQIDGNGLFTGTTLGNFTVTAHVGSLTATSSIAVNAHQVAILNVSPYGPTVSPGGTQQFNVLAYDSGFNSLPVPGNLTWSVSGGGTITQTGLFTAGTTSSGAFTVTATSGSVMGTTQVTVATAPTITAGPTATPAHVTTGKTSTISVQASQAGGTALTYFWYYQQVSTFGSVGFSPSSGASGSTTATFTAPGTYLVGVIVRNTAGLSVNATTTVVVDKTLTSLAVLPASAALAPGQSQAFTAQGRDQFNGTMSFSGTVAWSTSGGGTLDAGGVFTAGAAVGGPFTITAAAAGVTGTAPVTIAAPPTITSVGPASQTVSSTNAAVTATATDAGPQSALSYTWSVVSGPSSVYFYPNGSNSAASTSASFSISGTYQLQVSVVNAAGITAVSTPITVTVVSRLANLSLNPGFPHVAVGGQQAFTIYAYDQFFRSMMVAPTWSVTSGVGSIDGTGLFAAGNTPGSSTVTATVGTVTASTTVTVSAPPSITVAAAATPNPTTGTAVSLSVTATDPTGPNSLAYSWSASGVQPGQITFDASYLPTTNATFSAAGVYHLRVTVNNYSTNLSATSSVDVTVQKTLTRLVVLPTTMTLPLAGVLPLHAFALDQFGNSQPVAVAWSAAGGGTVDSSGTYHAPAIPGLATITATDAVDGLQGSASITTADATPMISAVTADPSTVAGTVATLAAVASDDGGPANLVYTWSLLSGAPAGVVFSTNGTTAAATTSATFSASGTYPIMVTVRDQSGSQAVGTVTVTVDVTSAAPRFLPEAGTFAQPIPVILAVGAGAPADARLWYTLATSGTPADPVPGAAGTLPYSGPLTVATTTTIKALITAADGHTVLSATASATYTLLDSTVGVLPPPPAGGSETSPYCVSVPAPTDGTQVSVDADGVIANDCHTVGPNTTYANMPLAQGQPTTVTTHVRTKDGSERTSSQQVSWVAIDLAGKHAPQDARVIRRGDSLLLTCAVSASWTLADGLGHVINAAAGDRMPIAFMSAGIYYVQAKVDGQEVGSLQVIAIDVPFTQDMIAAEVAYKRVATVTVQPNGQVAQVVFTAADSSLLTVTTDSVGYNTATLGLKPLQRGMPVVLARLGSATGPIIASKEVSEFTLEHLGKVGLIVNHNFLTTTAEGADEYNTRDVFLMRPFLPGVQFRCDSPDGLTAPQVIPAEGAKTRYDQVTRESIGIFGVSFFNLHPTTITWSTQAFQHGSNWANDPTDLTQVADEAPITAIVSRLSKLVVTNRANPAETTSANLAPDSLDPLLGGIYGMKSGITSETVPAPPGMFFTSALDVAVQYDVALSPPNPELMTRIFVQKEYVAFNGAGSTVYAIDGGTPVVSPSIPQAGQAVPDLLRFLPVPSGFEAIGGAPYACYVFGPYYDTDGDGIPDLGSGYLGTSQPSDPTGIIVFVRPPGTSVTVDPHPTKPSGIRISSAGGSGASIHHFNLNPSTGQYDFIIDQNDAPVTLDLGPDGTLKVVVTDVSPDGQGASGFSVFGSSNDLFRDNPVIINRIGNLTITSAHGSIAVKVRGTEAVFGTGSGQGETHFTTDPSGAATSGGPGGTALMTLDYAGDGFSYRPTTVQVSSDHPGSIVLHRDHPVPFFTGNATSPTALFPNDQALDVSVPLQQQGSLYSLPDIWPSSPKTFDVTASYVVDGVTRRSIRYLNLRKTLGAPVVGESAIAFAHGHAQANIQNGNLFFAAQIASYATPRMGPDLSLMYNSQEGLDCGYGPGWRSTYDMRLYDYGSDGKSMALIASDSTRLFFIDGKCQAVAGVNRAATVGLRKHLEHAGTSTADFKAGEAYKVVPNDNRLYYFNQDGWLVRIRDLRGDDLTISRAGDGTAFSVRDGAQTPRLLSLVRADLGGDAGSTGIKKLQAVTSGKWGFAYDGAGNITGITATCLDAATGPGTQPVPAPYDYAVTYTNTAVHTIAVNGLPAPYVTTVRYPTGSDIWTHVDAPEGTTDDFLPYGMTIHHRFDGVTRCQSPTTSFTAASKTTSPYFDATTIKLRSDMVFDDRIGNLIGLTVGSASGPIQTTTYAYTDLTDQDPASEGANLQSEVRQRAVTGVDGSGAIDLVTTTTYIGARGLSRGLVQTTTDPAGGVITSHYDSTGSLDKVTDARGKVWGYGDATLYGQPQLAITPTSRHVRTAFRSDGLPTSVTAVESGYTTSYLYEAQGMPSTVTYPGIVKPVSTAYDPFGNVFSTTDVEGRTFDTVRDALERPTSVPQLGAQPLLITYAMTSPGWDTTVRQNGQRLSETLTDPTGRTTSEFHPHSKAPYDGEVDYAYDHVYGWLNSISDERAFDTAFVHDDLGRVTSVKPPAGGATQVVPNGLGWVLSSTDLDGHTSTMRYDATGQRVLTVNPAGGSVRGLFDPAGSLVAQQPCLGSATRFEYDDDGVQVATIDVFGQRSVRSVDDMNKQVIVTRGGAPDAKVTTTLNVAGRPETVHNDTVGDTKLFYYPDGSTFTVQPPGRAATTRMRDSVQRTESVKTPTTLETNPAKDVGSSLTYNPDYGFVKDTTDPRKRVVTPLIMPTGEVDEVSDNAKKADGSATAPLQKVTSRDPAGNVLSSVDGAGKSTAQTFDANGRLQTRTPPDGVITTWVYTLGGLVDHVVRGAVTTTYGYNALGQATSTSRTDRAAQKATYDCLGTLLQRSDGLTATNYTYDPGTRQLRKTEDTAGHSTTYIPDALGRITDVKDKQEHGPHYTFTDLDRVSDVRYADGKTEHFTYYPTGEVHTHTDRSARVVTRVYDQSGVLLTETYEATGAVVAHGRDLPDGGGEKQTTTLGTEVTTRESDVRGRLATLTMPSSSALTFTYNDANQMLSRGATGFDYNSRGQLWHISVPGQGTATLNYDGNGRVQGVALPNGVTRAYGYDGADALASLTQQIGTLGNIESWGVLRDGQGHITQVAGPAGLVLSYAYDQSARMVQESRIGDLPLLTQYAYDGSDNRSDVVTFAAPQAQIDGFTGPAGGELLVSGDGSWTVSGGALHAAGAGAVTSAPLALTSSGAVAGPTVTATVKPALPGASSSATSAAGFTATAAGGLIYRVLWQLTPPAAGEFSPPVALGRLVVEQVGGSPVTVTVLAASDWSDDQGAGAVLSLTVWPDQRVTAQATPVGAASGIRFDVATPGLASTSAIPLALTAVAEGGAAGAGAFDDLAWTTSASRTWRHATYDPFNALLAEDTTSTDAAQDDRHRAFAYNTQGQLLTRTLRSGAGSAATEAAYGYDEFDRMTTAMAGGGTTAYAYYGESWLRRSATSGTVSTAWTYDGRNPLTQTVTMGGTALPTTSYLYNGNQPLWESGASGVQVYAHDPLGNVAGLVGALTNSTTTVNAYTRRFAYDAFGGILREEFGQLPASGVPELVTATGPASAGLRGKGMMYDGGTLNLYKTATRSYGPDLGRFTQVDPAKAGQNWYAYASGDPVNRWDPSGLDWVAFEGDDAYYYHEQDSWWPGRQSSGRTKIGTRGPGDLIQLDGAFQHSGRSMVEIGLLNEYAAGDFSGDTGLGMTSAKLNIRKAQTGNLPFSAWTAIGSELDEQNVKSSIVIYNGMTFGFDSDARRESARIIAEAKATGDNVTLAGYGFGEAGGRGLTAALGGRVLQGAAPVLLRGAALVPYGTQAASYLGTGLQVAGAAGTGWFAGTAINEAAHGNAYEATSALTDATNLGVGTFGSFFGTGSRLRMRTKVSREDGNQVFRVLVAGGQEASGGVIATFNPATGNLYVDAMSVSPRGAGIGSQVFARLLQSVGRGVTSITGTMAADNLRVIQAGMAAGLSAEEAARLTPAGRLRAAQGYTVLTYDEATGLLRASKP